MNRFFIATILVTVTAWTGLACTVAPPPAASPNDVDHLTTPPPSEWTPKRSDSALKLLSAEALLSKADTVAFGRVTLTADMGAIAAPPAIISPTALRHQLWLEYGWRKALPQTLPLERFEVTSCGERVVDDAESAPDGMQFQTGLNFIVLEPGQSYLLFFSAGKLIRADKTTLPFLALQKLGEPEWTFEREAPLKLDVPVIE